MKIFFFILMCFSFFMHFHVIFYFILFAPLIIEVSFHRLVQYSSRIIWANLEKKNSNKDLISKLKNLEYTLSTARKCKHTSYFYAFCLLCKINGKLLNFVLVLTNWNAVTPCWIQATDSMNFHKQNVYIFVYKWYHVIYV